MKGMCSATALL